LLSVQHAHAKGRRDDLLPPTSLQAGRGELLLVSAERQDHRTALALTLSGRMKPTDGRISWDGDAGIKRRRLASALVNSFEDIADLWTEQLAPDRRVELLTALALANPHTDLLVVDSPDRHAADTSVWLPRLKQLAYDAGRPLAVVATVAAIPAGWTGPAATVGNAVQRSVDAHAEAEAAVEPDETDLLLETEDAK
jgi:hypothetical protein